MRRCYLVCYDIKNAKRLNRIFKVMKGYGERWQYSIFFCPLKSIDRVRLQADLEQEMNLKEDQVLIIDLGIDEKQARDGVRTIGQSLQSMVENKMLII